MASRMMAQMRHIKQALASQPAWLEGWDPQLRTDDDGEGSDQEDGQGHTYGPEQVAWFVGWDTDLRKAWRRKSSEDPPEFADTYDTSLGDLDPIKAIWKDGHTAFVTDVTCGD
eukprot:3616385-Alexandrium_andersonii.AAC.1